MELSCYQGDTLKFTRTFQVDGSALNLTGSNINVTLSRESIPVASVSTSTHTDAVNGLTSVKFLPAQTSALLGYFTYTVKLTDSEGNISTMEDGTVEVKRG